MAGNLRLPIDDEMSKGERAELAKAVRMHARVARNGIEAAKAERLADFEEQLATEFKADDERWAKITAYVQQTLRDANAAIAHQCDETGVAEKFRPHLELRWYNRGENITAERRTELRRVATSRLDALGKAAKLAVDRAESDLCMDLAKRALTSSQARQWLEKLPSADALLPRLEIARVKEEAAAGTTPRLGRRDPWSAEDRVLGDNDA